MGWIGRGRVVVDSSDSASPNGGALHWAISVNRRGAAAVTVGLRSRIPGCDFPHLHGVVLATPYTSSAGNEEWAPVDRIRADADDGNQVEVRADVLIPPIVNLAVGRTLTRPLPVDPAEVVALLFGSLTNRLWFENDRHHLWLAHHDRTPTLDDWQRQIGSDPMVRRGRLVVAPDGISVDWA